MRTSRAAVACAAFLCLISTLLIGCQQGVPEAALQLSPESLAKRQLQTRIFDTADERSILQASSGVLQDLGFTLEESETSLGLLVASKDRTAVEAGQVVGQIMVAALLGVYTPIDEKQNIRASLVTGPLAGDRMSVRVTFQRVVWNEQGQISKAEFIEDPDIYAEFFEQLSQSVFLEANQI